MSVHASTHRLRPGVGLVEVGVVAHDVLLVAADQGAALPGGQQPPAPQQLLQLRHVEEVEDGALEPLPLRREQGGGGP